MEYRKLGDSDLELSSLSFGCMSLGEDFNENESLIHQAVDLGINFFDTADLYQKGLNEIHVGKALKNKRQSVFIATKVGNQWLPDGKSWNWNPSKDYILSAIDQSLKRLDTDYIDLYQLHGGTINDPIDETIEAFELLKQQGKIRHYGISSIRPNVINEYLKRSNIVSVMLQYSVLDRRPEENCLSIIHQAGKGVLVRGVLAKGLLIDKPVKDYLSYSAQEISTIQNAMNSLPKGISSLQAALQYTLNHEAVSSNVSGIRTTKQLQEVVQFSQRKPKLTNQKITDIKALSSAIKYTQHRL